MLSENNQNPSRYDLMVGFLQIFDLVLNMSQTSNDTILNELQHQNSDYLEKIVAQNEKILQNQTEILNRLRGE